MKTILVAIDGTTTDWYENVRFGPFDFQFSLIYSLYKTFSGQDKIHIAGPDLFGSGTAKCVGQALDFLKPRVAARDVRVVVAGYSRGAYAALRVAQGLDRAGIKVHLLALIDTVKCTDASTEEAIGLEILRYVEGEQATRVGPKTPVTSKNWTQGYNETMASYEIRKRRTDQLSSEVNLSNRFQATGNIQNMFHARRSPTVGSRTVPMGHWDVASAKGAQFKEAVFECTHSCMGGMPFRGDLPKRHITRASEWIECRRVLAFVEEQASAAGVLKGALDHPARNSAAPPNWWFDAPEIKSQYAEYVKKFGHDGLGRS